MKKVLLACLFMVAIATSTNAQVNPEFKKETVDFIKLTGASDAFKNAIIQIGATVPETSKTVYTKEANATLDGLYSKMANLYMKEFTQDEIKKLVAFYKTDLGKKLAKKQLGLSQKAMMFGQAWGMEVQQIAKKYNTPK